MAGLDSISPLPNSHVRLASGPRYALSGAALLCALGLLWFFLPLHHFQLSIIGLGLGAVLLLASFGFAAGYRQAFIHKDMRGVLAQIAMIILATLLFAPDLANGQVSGAIAPIGVQVAVGAFLFGIGMQLGGACASGTLFSLGGGSIRMGLTLIFFCLGAFIGSLHLGWWGTLPSWGSHSLGQLMGWPAGVSVQILVLSGLAGLLWFWHRRTHAQTSWRQWLAPTPWRNAWAGPWPLLWGAIGLALFNYATLQTAGHPWSVTWAFTLWGAKIASLLGWDASTSGFWTSPFQARALAGPLWADTTSLMNLNLILGALLAALWSGRFHIKAHLTLRGVAAALIGGLLMGYGARLAYGCNIGALFSGMASTSLHAWLWLPCALFGTWLGIKLRPMFNLKN